MRWDPQPKRLAIQKKTEAGEEEKHECSWWSQSEGWTGRGIGKELNEKKEQIAFHKQLSMSIEKSGLQKTGAEKTE